MMSKHGTCKTLPWGKRAKAGQPLAALCITVRRYQQVVKSTYLEFRHYGHNKEASARLFHHPSLPRPGQRWNSGGLDLLVCLDDVLVDLPLRPFCWNSPSICPETDPCPAAQPRQSSAWGAERRIQPEKKKGIDAGSFTRVLFFFYRLIFVCVFVCFVHVCKNPYIESRGVDQRRTHLIPNHLTVPFSQGTWPSKWCFQLPGCQIHKKKKKHLNLPSARSHGCSYLRCCW